jgi:hypothetical protein
MARILAAILLSLVLFPAAARAGTYDARKAGHPLRIAAYAVHPVGYALDRLLFHPVWWVGQHQPFRSIFGVERRYERAKPSKETEDSAAEPAS